MTLLAADRYFTASLAEHCLPWQAALTYDGVWHHGPLVVQLHLGIVPGASALGWSTVSALLNCQHSRYQQAPSMQVSGPALCTAKPYFANTQLPPATLDDCCREFV